MKMITRTNTVAMSSVGSHSVGDFGLTLRISLNGSSQSIFLLIGHSRNFSGYLSSYATFIAVQCSRSWSNHIEHSMDK